VTDCDALIVGGGPAGSICARSLRQAGWDVTVIDRAGFPRDKVCAGWLTPDVFRLLDLAPAEYRDAGLTLQEIVGFRTGLLRRPSVDTPYGRVVSYAIRRREFDEFLLRRADARVLEQTPLTSLRCAGRIWVVNEEIRTPLVISGPADTSVPWHAASAIAPCRHARSWRKKRSIDSTGVSVPLPRTSLSSSATISMATAGACGRASI